MQCADINYILSIDNFFGSISAALGDTFGLLLEYTMALEVPNIGMAQVVIPYFRILQYNFPMKDLISTASHPPSIAID